MNNTILVSGNAGQGKTTFAANLANAIQSLGYSVLLVDADCTTPKLAYHYKILPKRTIQHACLKHCTLKEALYQDPNGLKLLFSNLSPLSVLHPSMLLEDLKRFAEIVIIDVPTYDTKWYDTKEPTILLSQPDFPSIMDAQKLRKCVPNLLGLVINRAHHDAYELSPGNINQLITIPILGIIPETPEMREALKHGYPLIETHPDLKTSTLIKHIATHIIETLTLSHGTPKTP